MEINKTAVLKLVYCLPQTYVSGGRERVVICKANWLANHGYDVTIVTTDQGGKSCFFNVDSRVKMIDLGINYVNNSKRHKLVKAICFFWNAFQHKRKLKRLLSFINADVVISTFSNEMAYLPRIPDGSKKVLELHTQNKFVLQQEGHKNRLMSYFSNTRKQIDRFDKFVVLTETDKKNWGALANICSIPNSLPFIPRSASSLMNKKALAVGRLNSIKGFDRLINIWDKIHALLPEWSLEIVGDGELKPYLQNLIEEKKLQESVALVPNQVDIQNKYLDASMLLVTSRLEGFGMVIIEGQACGLPVISYNCPCGPSDIINDGKDGFLIEDGDEDRFVEAFVALATNGTLRKEMGAEAKLNSNRFAEDIVMNRWVELFKCLVNNAS